MVKNHSPNPIRSQPEARNTVSFSQIFEDCVVQGTLAELAKPGGSSCCNPKAPLVVMAGLVPAIPMRDARGRFSEIAGT
jgi:hypothetical protein